MPYRYNQFHCEQLTEQEIKALLLCHDNNPYAKFLGACSDVKTALDWCFKREKERIRAENLKRAKASSVFVKQKMKERRDRMANDENN